MSRLLSRNACVFTGLLSLPLFAMPAHAGDVSVESLREKNRQNLASVRTIVVEERVELQRTVPVEERRAQEARRIEDGRAWQLKQAAFTGESKKRIQEINEQADGQYGSFEASLVIEQMNATSSVRRTTTIDRDHRRARRDDVDPRNLTKMGKEQRLGQGQLMSLDRTGSLISEEGKPEIQLHTPRAGKLATINSFPQTSLDREEAQLGLLPEYLFGEDFSLEVRAAGEKRFQIIAKSRTSGRTVFEATVDAEKGYAMTELRGFDAGGELVQVLTASDFRCVDGVWLPFETRSEYPATPITPTVIERHVDSARINPDISDALFAPPSDYRVVDLTGGASAANTKAPAASVR
ncbi:MAG: hypothetical protein AMXMBFR47_29690 [Planctomycetota bacterium]